MNNWIINESVALIQASMLKRKVVLNGVVSEEARGWLFAAPIALKLGLPLYTARKKGKLPGNIVSIEYEKECYNDGIEVIELSKNVTGFSLLMVDDGIASGITCQTLYDLVLSNHNEVPIVLNVIRHTSVECKFSPHNNTQCLTLFDL